jgi:hypothetical protein
MFTPAVGAFPQIMIALGLAGSVVSTIALGMTIYGRKRD